MLHDDIHCAPRQILVQHALGEFRFDCFGLFNAWRSSHTNQTEHSGLIYEDALPTMFRSLLLNSAGIRTSEQLVTFLSATEPLGQCLMCRVFFCRSVTDPRDGKRVALKKMPNVFQNLISCKRVYRELKMLATFKHDNVSSSTFPTIKNRCLCSVV